MANLSQNQISFGIREQTTDYVTAAAEGSESNWTWLRILEPPTWTPARKLEAIPKSPTGSRMAAPAPIAGSRDGGTLTFRMQLRSQPTAYDPEADTPGATLGTDAPVVYLLNKFFGTTSGHADIAAPFAATSSDANTWEKASGSWTLNSGCWHPIGSASGDTLYSSGWISTQSTSTAQLVQDMADPDSAGANLSAYDILPAVTLSPLAGYAPTPLTFRMPNNTDEDWIWVGGFPQSARISLNAGETPVVEFTFVCAWQTLDASSFALQAPTEYQTVPMIVDKNRGRAWIGGVQLSDGSATAADKTCGISELTVEIVNQVQPILCHGGGGAVYYDVSDRVLVDTEVTISATITLGDDWQSTATDHDLDVWLETPTARSISLEVGTAPGHAFAMIAPACYQQSQWTPVTVGESLIGAQTTWSPGAHTSDDAGAAGDSPFRLAFG